MFREYDGYIGFGEGLAFHRRGLCVCHIGRCYNGGKGGMMSLPDKSYLTHGFPDQGSGRKFSEVKHICNVCEMLICILASPAQRIWRI